VPGSGRKRRGSAHRATSGLRLAWQHVVEWRAGLDDLSTIEPESLDPLTFLPAGVSVYQLGNNGTAAKRLEAWAV
jgi:hypothetical protein